MKFEIWVNGVLKGTLDAQSRAMARKAARYAGRVDWGDMKTLDVIPVEDDAPKGVTTRCKKAPGTVQYR